MNAEEVIAEIEAAPPEIRELIMLFLDLLLKAQRAGITLPPIPEIGEEARA